MISFQNLLQGINSALKSPTTNLPHYACHVSCPSCIGAQAQDTMRYDVRHKISHAKIPFPCIFIAPGLAMPLDSSDLVGTPKGCIRTQCSTHSTLGFYSSSNRTLLPLEEPLFPPSHSKSLQIPTKLQKNLSIIPLKAHLGLSGKEKYMRWKVVTQLPRQGILLRIQKYI